MGAEILPTETSFTSVNVNFDKELTSEIAKSFYDPLRFVLFIFPWKGKGTVLQDEDGPDEWQNRVLGLIRDRLSQINGKEDVLEEAIRIATASGHGIGKTSLVAWLILWFVSTREHPQIIVTANTLSQLTSKTWRELAKWHKLALNKGWFTWTATKFYMKTHPETWFATAIPWSKDNPEAFAGTHEKHVLIIFDEASGIDDVIWDVTEGAMTTPGAFWFVFGNPTKNTGKFRECFGKQKHRWTNIQVDSRTAKKADKKQINQWIEDYGEDSDFVRIRVRGIFPRSSSEQFISNEILEWCNKYQAEGFDYLPKVMGVDVARYGDNQTVFCTRQGRKVFPLQKFRGIDPIQTASRISEILEGDSQIQAVFVDGGGVGGAVIDKLRLMGYGLKIIDVQSGHKADDSGKYYNKKSEMWGRMKEALTEGLDLPNDKDLEEQLTSVEYGFSDKNQIQIEKKSEMKSRGLSSPDEADSLALTYAQKIVRKDFESKQNVYQGQGAWMT